jgi:O-antigen ligase
MPRPADFVSRLAPALGVVGFAALGLITLASPGATRMHAWPWSLAYAAALAAPGALLLLRLFDRAHPLAVPRRGWLVVALAAIALPILSALFSPYRGPGLLNAGPWLSAVALFLVVFDWLQVDPARREALLRVMGAFLAVVAMASLAHWAADLPGLSASEVANARNPYPLGHSNYTAGLAVLMLPILARLAWRTAGLRRAAWTGALVMALAMLATSGSRGGLVGLAVLLVSGLVTARLGWKKTLAVAALAAAAVVLLAFAHPRTRAVFQRASSTEPNVSNLQRTAMFEAGVAMGVERPLLGWGAGSTPLAYPRFRRRLEGGTENALQLHSLPVQLWAELGAAGIAGLIALAWLVVRHAHRDPVAAVALAGYLAFALTDYQLDVPVFAFALAALAACLAPPDDAPSPVAPRVIDWTARFALIALIGFGRSDPTPAFNVRALTLAREPAKAAEAIELLETSLKLNRDQEIAHFNLGWLLVVSRPAEAESHFLAAARLVPDKGGVYFGLGLARLNQGRSDDATRAFALEGVNDPVFLTSPWWRETAFKPLRPATLALMQRFLAEAARRREVDGTRTAKEIFYLAALIRWFDDPAAPGEMLARANTAERTAYFAGRPALPAFATAPVQLSRRERTGYPVLMRNLDLPVPTDLFDVQENALAVREFRFLFPRKGWLPAPILVSLLETQPAP